MAKKNILILILFILITLSLAVSAQKDICAVYFTGVGCPHCARADPFVLVDLVKEYPDLIVIEYEIYQQQENAPLIYEYDAAYNSGFGIPMIIFEDENIVGDTPITKNTEKRIQKGKSKCPVLNGKIDFNLLDITALPGKPNIWTNERILIKTTGGNNLQLLKNLLTADDFSSAAESIDYKVIEPIKVPLSGKYVNFENAVQLNGWIFQWNGEPIASSKCPSCPQQGEWTECKNETKTRTNYKCSAETDFKCVSYTEVAKCKTAETKLTIAKLISLAVVDAINPCALAVLTLMLVAILTYNPRKKINVLLAGLAFTASVFIMYLLYGLLIIKFFQLVQILTAVRLWLYNILGFAAVVLGILNIKDYIKYRPGGPCTEMPLFMRPKIKRIIEGITSPKGAFFVGIFVTVFLLPCTIGPYIIAGGILSAMDLIKTLPPLLLYNLIFVAPMIIITTIVYLGISKVEDVSGWKEKNIRTLHLIAGMIMFALGLAMLLGWV